MTGLGWVKMRGKKSKVLGCGCCMAEDFRDEILWQEAANEIRYGEGDAYPTPGEWAYMDEIDRRNAANDGVDAITYAKYTWGAGLTELRIEAILAQRHADMLKRTADWFDSLTAKAA